MRKSLLNVRCLSTNIVRYINKDKIQHITCERDRCKIFLNMHLYFILWGIRESDLIYDGELVDSISVKKVDWKEQ